MIKAKIAARESRKAAADPESPQPASLEQRYAQLVAVCLTEKEAKR